MGAGMNPDEHDRDEALLAELAQALTPLTTPPPEVVEAGRQSFTWRTIDAELAALVYDSLLDDEPATARSAPGPRFLTFESGELTIEVEVDPAPAGRRLLGQIVPPQAAELELRPGTGAPVSATADALGRFTIPLPQAVQRVGLRVRLADGTEIELPSTLV
jgi:hypothetical protein